MAFHSVTYIKKEEHTIFIFYFYRNTHFVYFVQEAFSFTFCEKILELELEKER